MQPSVSPQLIVVGTKHKEFPFPAFSFFNVSLPFSLMFPFLVFVLIFVSFPGLHFPYCCFSQSSFSLLFHSRPSLASLFPFPAFIFCTVSFPGLQCLHFSLFPACMFLIISRPGLCFPCCFLSQPSFSCTFPFPVFIFCIVSFLSFHVL